MTPQQKIFKVLIEHNRILDAGAIEPIFAKTPDPEDVIGLLAEGEQVNPGVAEKLMELYRHNLKKHNLPSMKVASGSPSTATATATATAAPAAPPAARPAARAAPMPPPKGAPVPPAAAAAAPVSAEKPAEVSVGEYFALPTGAPIEAMLALLRRARELRASDLHLMSQAVPIIRVGSRLREMNLPALPADQVEACLRSILTPEQNKHFTENMDLDFSYDAGANLGRMRVNYLRQHRGMDGIFRLIPDRVPTFEELKLPPQVRKFTQFRQGVVLVTGPKGSGKTTTLASLIDLINTNRAEHIITIEDPIEFVHPCKKGHVNQREVGTHTTTFANALRASLREAPDVIMVGEMRDLETTALAITAAETGHLVFGTLHTPDAARTIGRVIDVFPPKEQGQIRAMFSESLRGVLSQHLLPGLDGSTMHLATEVMFNTGAIGNLIRDNRAFQLQGIIQTHRKQGMHLMDESLIDLVKLGHVAKEEAMSRATNLAYVDKELRD